MTYESINIYKGIPLEILVRINPEINENNRLRIFENKITLMDEINKPFDDFISKYKILQNQDSFEQNFSEIFERDFLHAIIEGTNFTTFTFGEKGSGKTFCLEGNESEKGVYEIIFNKILIALEHKKIILNQKQHPHQDSVIINKNESNSNAIISNSLSTSNFSYNVKLRFIQLLDENCYDLLQKYNYFKQPAEVIYTELEGFSCVGAAWVNVSNIENFNSLIKESLILKKDLINNYSNNGLNNRASTILTIEISQILNQNCEEENVKNDFSGGDICVSKINIIDLPSANILIENKNVFNNDNYKSIFAFQNMISGLVKSNLTLNIDPEIFEFSNLTKFIKEYMGMNSICLGIFTFKNDNSDFKIIELIFKLMKLSQKIYCHPMENNKYSNAILRKFRSEIIYLNNKLKNLNTRSNNQKNNNSKENKFVSYLESNQNFNKINHFNLNSNIPLVDRLKNKVIILEKEIERLKQELNLSEEEKIKFLNSYNLNINQGEIHGHRNYDNGEKYLSKNTDLIDQDINEQIHLMKILNNIQEKLNSIVDEKKVIEEENLNLRSAYLKLANEIEKIKNKNMNLVNNLNIEILQLKNLLNTTKAEIEFLRNSRDDTIKIKDSFMQDMGIRKNEFEERLHEIKNSYDNQLIENSTNQQKSFDKEKRDLLMKIENLSDEIKELNNQNKILIDTNNKTKLQYEETRNCFKELLSMYSKETEKFNFFENINDNIVNNQQPHTTSQNLNNKLNTSVASNQLNKNSQNIPQNKNNINSNPTNTNIDNSFNNLSTYDNLKFLSVKSHKFYEELSKIEKDLLDSLNLEKSKNKNLRETNINLKILLRKIKNIALDYYPLNQISISKGENLGNSDEVNYFKSEINNQEEYHNILFGELDNVIDNQENEGLLKFYEYEIDQLRKRISDHEIERSILKKTSFNEEALNKNITYEKEIPNKLLENEIQIKILDEIGKLKQSSSMRASSFWQDKELEKLKFDNYNLKEEIIKLKKNIIILSRNSENGGSLNSYPNNLKNDNEKLMKKLQIKNDFLTKIVNKLEKENVELKIKTTIAEEQLVTLQRYIDSAKRIK